MLGTAVHQNGKLSIMVKMTFSYAALDLEAFPGVDAPISTFSCFFFSPATSLEVRNDLRGWARRCEHLSQNWEKVWWTVEEIEEGFALKRF